MTQKAEPPTVADLTSLHVGWEVQVDDPGMFNAVRSIWLLADPRADRTDIELHDGLRNPGRVTAFRYPPETPCKVTRRFPPAAPPPYRHRMTTPVWPSRGLCGTASHPHTTTPNGATP